MFNMYMTGRSWLRAFLSWMWRNSGYFFWPGYWAFLREFRRFRRLSASHDRGLGLGFLDLYPCLHDKKPDTSFDRHYVYHCAWAAGILASNHPRRHVDIASSLYFASLVSAFIPIDFYDYRPPDLHLENLSVRHVDLLRLPFPDDSVPSLSCMHVVEHVGLGRYGDPLAPNADLSAISELIRVLSPGGVLLFVVPVGNPGIAFNAHRIYGYRQVLEYFHALQLKEFSLISQDAEKGGLIRNPPEKLIEEERYGCGCFYFVKPR